MSFSGISTITGMAANLFAWEDLTRASIPNNPQGTDSQFNDLIFAIEGISAVQPSPPPQATVPEPGSLGLFLVCMLVALPLRRLLARRTTFAEATAGQAAF